MDDVRLPELQVIQRFSIAVRQEYASAEEVVEALKADLAAITGSSRATSSATRKPATKRTTAKRSTAKRSPKKRSTARRSR